MNQFGGQAPVRRSNRPVTQFACQHTENFLLGKAVSTRQTVRNTTVECEKTKNHAALSVKLYGHEILGISMSLPDEEIKHIAISVGTGFTMEGYPTRTSLERLNGLLDAMGIHGVIPEGVRIFKNQEQGIFCFGKGDNWIPVGQHHARNIILSSDPDEFIVESSDIGLDWSIMKKRKTQDGKFYYEKQDRLAGSDARKKSPTVETVK